MLKVDPEQLRASAGRLRALSEKIGECYNEMISINSELQATYEGASAVSFDQFVEGTAKPVLDRTRELCYDTGRGLDHTATQFEEADQTMSGVFNTAL